jgi:hypothetical protein
MRRCNEPAIAFIRRECGITMHVTDFHLKIIALGLIPVFFVLSALLPKTTTSYLLLGIVMIVAMVICYIGMSMQKKGAQENEDLLALPPKK